jgi:hypothetical protein
LGLVWRWRGWGRGYSHAGIFDIYKSFGSNDHHIANTVPFVISIDVIILCIIASLGGEDFLRE